MTDFVGKKHTCTFIISSITPVMRERTIKTDIVFKTIEEEGKLYQPGDHVYFPDIDKSVEILIVEKVYPSGHRYITDYAEFESIDDTESFEAKLNERMKEFPQPGSITPVASVTGKKKWWHRR